MEIAKSDIVRSDAGRDQGKLFIVLAVEGEYLLLADGKGRKVEVTQAQKAQTRACLWRRTSSRLADKIKRSEKITNSELRRTLAAYRGEVQPDQEG